MNPACSTNSTTPNIIARALALQQCRRMFIIVLALKPEPSRSRLPLCLLFYFRSSYFSEIKLSTPTICLRGFALHLRLHFRFVFYTIYPNLSTTTTIYHMRLAAPVRVLGEDDECARSAFLIQFILDKVTICA